MANNIKKLLPTDIISDSMDKINSNFDILSSYSAFSDKSLTEYYKKIDDLVNQISGKVDLSESRLNTEFEKIRGEIEDYNVDMSSINQTAEMIQSTVSGLNKKFDGTIEVIQSQLTQTKDNINSVVEKYKEENKSNYNSIQKVLDGFQDQIDGNIETWYYDGEPTLNNEPVITWIKDVSNEEEKNKIYEKHQGDLYYDRTTGFAYRFFKEGDVYTWKLIRDYEITEMLGKINQKSKIFTSTPVPPYNVGDMWIDSNKDLFVCIRKRDSGIWSKEDWDYATRYETDLDDFKAKYQTDKTDFQNQIDGKIQYWFQDDDPSFNWTTDDERKKHINDLWYNTKHGITKVYIKTDSGYVWHETTDKNLESLVQSAAGGNITIFYGEYGEGYDDEGNPRVKPSGYKRGDLWYDCTYPTGTKLTDSNNKYYHDTLRCQVEQGDSSFAIEHWVPINGGDRAFSRISQDVDNISLEVYGSSEDGKDSLRSLISQRVTTGELEEVKTSITNKIDTEKNSILAQFDSYVTNDNVNGIQSAVNKLNAQINEGDSSIVSKLSQQATEIGDVKTAVGKLESAIGSGGDGSDTSIAAALQVLTEKDKEHDSAISSLQSSVKQNGEDIASAKIDISTNTNNITNLTKAIAEIETKAGNAASKLDLESVSDKANANESSIANLTAEIEGDDGQSGLKAGLENAVSRIGENESAITGLITKIGDDESGIISQINAQAIKMDDVETAQINMQSEINGHTASIKTMVTKDEMNSAISNITLDADRININADHKLSILTNGAFELSSDNCTITEDGTLTAKNATIEGDITANQFIAFDKMDTKRTTITGNSFEIAAVEKTDTSYEITSSISISLVNMNGIDGYSDAPSELQGATNVPTLCMNYNGQTYYLWPGAWKTTSGGDTTSFSETRLFSNGSMKKLEEYYRIVDLDKLDSKLSTVLSTSYTVEESIRNIAKYFINITYNSSITFDGVYSNTGGNNVLDTQLGFLPDFVTGLNEYGYPSSSITNPSSEYLSKYNYVRTYNKLTSSDLSNTSQIWSDVCDYYSVFKDGGYVEIGKKCATVMVSDAYEYITSGGTQESANTALDINAMNGKYMLAAYLNGSHTGLYIKPNTKTILWSPYGYGATLSLYYIVSQLIPATATTDDERTIKNFIGNTSSTTEVQYSGMTSKEFVILEYPIMPISLGSTSGYTKYLWVAISSGKSSLSNSIGWSWYSDVSKYISYRPYYFSYYIGNDPNVDETGTRLSTTDASTNMKKILATLISNLNNYKYNSYNINIYSQTSPSSQDIPFFRFS